MDEAEIYNRGETESRELTPAAGHTAIQTTGSGSIARRIAPPRDIRGVMNNIKIMAAMAGDDWYYQWPTKNSDGTVGSVEGPSIKCATAVARMYGNCEVTCVVKESATHHIFEATFVDLETGYALTRPFQQRRDQNMGGKMDKERKADIIFQIGVSKATRNVINNALEVFTDFAKEEAKKSLVETIGKDLPKAKERILLRFSEHRIDIKRVEAVYAKKSNEWLAPDIAKMVAQVKAISDGMANKDETYPPTAEEAAQHIKDVENSMTVANTAAKNTAAAEPAINWDDVLDEILPALWNAKSEKEINEFVDENKVTLKTISDKAPDHVKERWASQHAKAMERIKKGAVEQEKKDVIKDKMADADKAQFEETEQPVTVLSIPQKEGGGNDWNAYFGNCMAAVNALKTPDEFKAFEIAHKATFYDMSKHVSVAALTKAIEKGKGGKK